MSHARRSSHTEVSGYPKAATKQCFKICKGYACPHQAWHMGRSCTLHSCITLAGPKSNVCSPALLLSMWDVHGQGSVDGGWSKGSNRETNGKLLSTA